MPTTYSIRDTCRLRFRQYAMYITDFEEITELIISNVDGEHNLGFYMPPKLVKLVFTNSHLANIDFNIPASVQELDLSNNLLTSISSKILKHVKHLTCNYNKLSSIEGILDSLQILICINNPLQSLTFANPITSNLVELDCSLCKLTELPELPQGLLRLICSSNMGLAKLPQIPASLEFLDCRGCTITVLPEFPVDSKLKELKCSGCELTYILSLPSLLEILICANNNITYLPAPLPDTLTELNCSANSLVILPIPLPKSLVSLKCSSNRITKLPSDISSLTKLKTLHCAQNNIEVLPELPACLSVLHCRYNNLSVFPMQIPTSLTWLDCSNNTKLQWLPPLPHGLSYARLDTVALPLDTSAKSSEITPEIITYINKEHECLFRKWLVDRLAVYRTELLERQLEIAMSPDRIARLVRNGDLGEIGTWTESLGF